MAPIAGAGAGGLVPSSPPSGLKRAPVRPARPPGAAERTDLRFGAPAALQRTVFPLPRVYRDKDN